jgi:hypothetical protein
MRKTARGNARFLNAFKKRTLGGIIMIEYSQLASPPILAGPYSRRRWVRHRQIVRQIGMLAVAVTATGALLALAF